VSTTVSAQTASNISFTPTGAIASNNVQTALAELDTEKLALAGGTVTGELLIGAAGSLVLEGSTADGFETTIAVVDPTADRTITLPNVTGTVITTADSGTVTSTMILDGTIVNADINASAAIADTKLATIATALKVSNSATTAASANTASAIVARDGSGNFTAGTITAALTGAASSNVLKAGDTMTGPLVVPLASAATPSLTFTSDLNTGIYSPGADQVAISTNGTERLLVDSAGRVGLGTASGGERLFVDGDIGFSFQDYRIWTQFDNSYRQGIRVSASTRELSLFSTTNDSGGIITFYTRVGAGSSATDYGTERMRLDSSGRLGLGTSSPQSLLHVEQANVNQNLIASAGNAVFRMADSATSGTRKEFTITLDNTNNRVDIQAVQQGVATRNITLNSQGGNVGIGTTSPASKFAVSDAGAGGVEIEPTGLIQSYNRTTSAYQVLNIDASELLFRPSGTECARIDSSGRLLVGTSSARDNFYNTTQSAALQVEGDTSNAGRIAVITNFSTATSGASGQIVLARSGATTIGSTTLVADSNQLGIVSFQGADGTEFVEAARIAAEVDGTPGANDMPGRLVFSITADGAVSPTEALRISNDRSITVSDGGNVVLGTTTGTKIGTATTQKLGFYNATPVVQPTAVADATDAASVITQLNDLLAKLRTLGIIAT
jgi:hypothetical protein